MILRLLLLWSVCGTESWQPRIYLGTDDTKNEFPFVVSYQSSERPYSRVCTGSLLAATWVITAAHCIDEPSRIQYANFTLKKRRRKGAYVKVIKNFNHPHYIDIHGLSWNDIALVLTEKVPRTAFVKLSAIDYYAFIGLPVKYAGFGVTNKGDVSIQEDEYRPLQVGDGMVIPYVKQYPMFAPAICIVPKCTNKYQDTRPGDSGGPLVLDGKIIGVLIGEGDEDDLAISYYTPVSPYLEWIRDTMNPGKHEEG